jgi:hypothetical protein
LPGCITLSRSRVFNRNAHPSSPEEPSHSSLPAALRPRVLWKKPAVSCVPRSTPHICRETHRASVNEERIQERHSRVQTRRWAPCENMNSSRHLRRASHEARWRHRDTNRVLDAPSGHTRRRIVYPPHLPGCHGNPPARLGAALPQTPGQAAHTAAGFRRSHSAPILLFQPLFLTTPRWRERARG